MVLCFSEYIIQFLVSEGAGNTIPFIVYTAYSHDNNYMKREILFWLLPHVQNYIVIVNTLYFV